MCDTKERASEGVPVQLAAAVAAAAAEGATGRPVAEEATSQPFMAFNYQHKLMLATMANPSQFIPGTFGIKVEKQADGTVVIELHDLEIQHGGSARRTERELGMTYEKFVEYFKRSGNKMMRVCGDGYTGPKIVVGEHGADKNKFATIAAEIPIAGVPPYENLLLRDAWNRAYHSRRSLGSYLVQVIPADYGAKLPESLWKSLGCPVVRAG